MYTLKAGPFSFLLSSPSKFLSSGPCCSMSLSDLVIYPFSVLKQLIGSLNPTAASIAGIVCEKYEVLCEADGFSFHSAAVYLEGVAFISITYVLLFQDMNFSRINLLSIALYGLFVFYGLMHGELQNRRPMAKFLSIKLIVMFTFYQAFMVCWLCLGHFV